MIDSSATPPPGPTSHTTVPSVHLNLIKSVPLHNLSQSGMYRDRALILFQTLALYKTFTYLLTYLLQLFPHVAIKAKHSVIDVMSVGTR